MIKIKVCKHCSQDNPDYLSNCTKCGNSLNDDNTDNNPTVNDYIDDEYHLPKNFKFICLIIAVLVILILAPLGYLAYNEYSQDELFYDTIDNVTKLEQPYKDQRFDIIQIVNETDYVKDFYTNYSVVLDEKISKVENMKSKISNPEYIEFADLVIEESKLKKEGVNTMQDLLNDVDDLNKNNDSRALNDITQKQDTFGDYITKSDEVANRTTEFIKTHQEIKQNFNDKGIEV